MKKCSILLILLACLLLLSGCWDKREVEDNVFAVLLGIDATEEGHIIISIAFPLTQKQGGGLNEGIDNGSGNYSVMSVKAPTVVEGLSLFGTKLSEPLALHSVKTIVISQEVAEGEMLRQVFSSWRYEEIRNTTNVLISECKAADFIKARIQNAPIDPLRQEELLLEQANLSAYYRPIQFLEFLENLKSGSGDSIAMYGTIAEEIKEESPKQGEGQEQQKEEGEKDEAQLEKDVKPGYLPSEIPITAENVSQISGLAVFKDSKMVGVLNSSEAQTYSMIAQDGTKKILTIRDPLDPESDVAVEILSAGRSVVHSAIQDGAPVFTIDVRLRCTVERIQSGVDYRSAENFETLTECIRDACAQNMADLIDKAQKEYDADIFKLGDRLAYHFLTIAEWEAYDWPGKYKDAEINLNVSMTLEGIGMIRA